jgi:hypothetical protein
VFARGEFGDREPTLTRDQLRLLTTPELETFVFSQTRAIAISEAELSDHLATYCVERLARSNEIGAPPNEAGWGRTLARGIGAIGVAIILGAFGGVIAVVKWLVRRVGSRREP